MADKQRKIELLAPAGNWERFVTAIQFGADAVYLGTTAFSLRNLADNFTLEQVAEAVRYAHERSVKVYVTVNAFMRDEDLENLPETIAALDAAGADALIINDPSVIRIAKRVAPNLPLHLSTQANTLNSEAALFWHEQGIERIVLARELTLSQIAQMRRKLPETLELEAFVHGAMCVSYSGRCLFSNYIDGRDSNRGECVQPCRWSYEIRERGKGGEYFTVVADRKGSFILNSRDMCMAEHLSEVIDSGIISLKIEGRMKSAYYTACVTNAYKLALRDAQSGKPFNPACMDELNGVSHREYCTGFWYISPHEQANIVEKNEYLCEKAFLATVTEYDPVTGLAKCFQRNKMFGNSDVQLLSPGKLGRTVHVSGLYDIEMNPIDSTPHPCMEFYMKVDSALPGDIIRGS